MNENSSVNVAQAIQHYSSARQKAVLQEIITRFTGESTELLSFDEVRRMLRAQVGSKNILKEIPIKAIVGSVNRYQDFYRGFLPSGNINLDRWVNIELANQGFLGLPPIEAYQIGEVYFVSDGNHRISVARQLGATEIQAYVTEVHTKVPLTEDVHPEELIIKSEYANFLENTKLYELRPEAELIYTEPGQYSVVEEHIAVHRYFMGIEQQREIPNAEAVLDWYEIVYLPIVKIIRERGLLHDFPDRTEADLYLWIAEHRAALADELKSQITINDAVQDLTQRFGHRKGNRISIIGTKVIKAMIPDQLKSGPPAGEWRQNKLSAREEAPLIADLLVPINGHPNGWYALDQAIVIATRNKSKVHGLYVLVSENEIGSTISREVQDTFYSKCEAASVGCELQIKTGSITENIFNLARWKDLVVTTLNYPPPANAISRLKSGIRILIQRCPIPLLFTPRTTKQLNHALLVYDGCLRSREALYIASHLSGTWNIPLDVFSIGKPKSLPAIQAGARDYLEDQNIQAEFTCFKKDGKEEIFELVHRKNIDLLITGGYNHNPFHEILWGDPVDDLLRQSQTPVLVCN